jgi:hypothetical protein
MSTYTQTSPFATTLRLWPRCEPSKLYKHPQPQYCRQVRHRDHKHNLKQCQPKRGKKGSTNQTSISLKLHNSISDHVPLNDAPIASNVNNIAIERERHAADILRESFDHLNCASHQTEPHQGKSNKHEKMSNNRMIRLSP